MIHIARNNIIAISASSENSEFPASRMLGLHPTRPYKAVDGVNFAIITADVIGGCSDILIAGTNAVAAVVTGIDPNVAYFVGGIEDMVVDGEDPLVDGLGFIADGDASGPYFAYDSGVLTPATTAEQATLPGGLPWVQPDGDTVYLPGPTEAAHYAEQSAYFVNTRLSISGQVTQLTRSRSLYIHLDMAVDVPVRLIIKLLTGRGSTIEAGIATACPAETYGNCRVRYGLHLTRDDKSIQYENSNGSDYYFKKSTPRVFDCEALMLTENAVKFSDFYDDFGKKPTGWKLISSNGDWTVLFAKLDGPPKISKDYPRHCTVTWTLKEVI